MAVDIIAKMKPKNNGKFALLDAVDVEMPGGSRLPDSFEKYTGAVNLYGYNIQRATIDNGVLYESTKRLATADFIPVGDANTVTLSADDGYCYGAEFYSEASEAGYISDIGDTGFDELGWGVGKKRFPIPKGAAYMRCVVKKLDESEFTNTELMPMYAQLVYISSISGGGDTATVKTIDLVALGLPSVSVNETDLGAEVSVGTNGEDLREEIAGAAIFKVPIRYIEIELVMEIYVSRMILKNPDGVLMDENFYGAAFLLGVVPFIFSAAVSRESISVSIMPIQSDNGEGGGTAIPTFDLTDLGLPDIPMDGTSVYVDTSTTAITEAIRAGAVKFSATVSMEGQAFQVEAVTGSFGVPSEGTYFCTTPVDFIGTPMMFSVMVVDTEDIQRVSASVMMLANPPEVPTTIDLSALDTEGKIVETYADGASKTTTMEFDADGNPVKITDSDGNVTTLIW